MSASQQTTNYNLPKFAGADKPAWLVDFNGAMDTIDISIKTIEDLSSGLSGQIDQNTSDITDLETGLGNAQSLISTNTSDITNLENTKAPITNPNFVGTVYANGLNLLLLKNAIINGGFQVNQRAKSGTVILNAGQYGHDRWKAGTSGCTYTFNTIENLTTITITAGSLIQTIDGLNLETDIYTLAWEGTAQGKIGAGSYGSTGLTGSVTGGSNLNIEFNVGTISKVRFNRGSTPIIWQTEKYDDVLKQCEWYCRPIVFGPNCRFLAILSNAGNTATIYPIPKMRATPTATITNNPTTKLVRKVDDATSVAYTTVTLTVDSLIELGISVNASLTDAQQILAFNLAILLEAEL